jgi:hypothetical protein
MLPKFSILKYLQNFYLSEVSEFGKDILLFFVINYF